MSLAFRESPFISERSLRIVSTNTQQSSQDDFCKYLCQTKIKLCNHSKEVGYFDSNNRIQWDVCPKVGEMYHFYDPAYPPDFNSGQWQRSVLREVLNPEAHDLESEKIIAEGTFQPPPFPLWANGDVAVVDQGKKATKLNIKKGNSTIKDPPPVTGWQAIMAEMNRRKDKVQLKKVEPVVEKNIVKVSKKKRKGKDFKDVMEELSYKLAKLRGEIVESDGDDEVESDVPVKINVTKDAPLTIMATNTSTTKKLTSKPDLLSLLAKIKPPNSVAAVSENVQFIASSSLPSMAAAAPSFVPRPPAVPVAWPPELHLEPGNSIPRANELSSILPVDGEKVKADLKQLVVVELERLPVGFYIPQLSANLVAPGSFLSCGLVVQHLVDEMCGEVIQCAGNLSGTPVDGLALGGRLTVNDLPLPSDFHAAVERMHKAQDVRQQRSLLEKSLELRCHLPSAPSKPTGSISVPFVSNVDERKKNKTRSYRSTSIAPSHDLLPKYVKSILNTPLYHEIRADESTAAWINQFRTKSESFEGEHGIVKRRSKVNKVPNLSADKIVARRATNRREKQQLEQVEQELEQGRIKAHREFLRVKALHTAQDAGVYRPSSRFHQHEKTISKYSGRSDVGLNLAFAAQQSFDNYTQRNLTIVTEDQHHVSKFHSRRLDETIVTSPSLFSHKNQDIMKCEVNKRQYCF